MGALFPTSLTPVSCKGLQYPSPEPTSVLDLTTSPASSPGTSPHRFTTDSGAGTSLPKSSIHHLQKSMQLYETGVSAFPTTALPTSHSCLTSFKGYGSGLTILKTDNDAMSTGPGSSSENEVAFGKVVLDDLESELDLDFVVITANNLGDVLANGSARGTGENMWVDDTVLADEISEVLIAPTCTAIDESLKKFDHQVLLNDSLVNPVRPFTVERNLLSFPNRVTDDLLSPKSEASVEYQSCMVGEYNCDDFTSPLCIPQNSSSLSTLPDQENQWQRANLISDSMVTCISPTYRSAAETDPRESTLLQYLQGVPITDWQKSMAGLHGSAFEQQEEKGLGLVHLLLRCGEMVGERRYDVVQPLLNLLQRLSSSDGDPMERIAFYFSYTLLRTMAQDLIYGVGPLQQNGLGLDFVGLLTDEGRSQMQTDESYLAFYQALPYAKFVHFTANQAILEALSEASRVHVIDFEIKQGLQWPNLLQSLAIRPEGPPELIKLSAVGHSIRRLNQIGTTLSEFAESLQINFTFCPIVINRFQDLHRDLFQVGSEEALAVNFPDMLDSILWDGVPVEKFLAFVRSLRPKIFTVIDSEKRHYSPSFVRHFIEVLFFYGALFDSLEESLDRRSPDRAEIERFLLGSGMRKTVSCTGGLGFSPHSGMGKWQSLLDQGGFKATPFSQHAVYQARMLLGLHASDGFAMGENGHALTVGWKETPLFGVLASVCTGSEGGAY